MSSIMLHEPPMPATSSPMDQRIEDAECAIQTLYEGDPRCICCKNWIETPPADLRPPPEADPQRTQQKALIVRMSKNHDDDAGTRPPTLHSIVVQSPVLQQTLTEVFAGYQGISTASVQRQPKLRQRHEDPVAAGLTQLLYEVLDRELGELRAEIHNLLAQCVITYPLLWALFEPGTNVVTYNNEHDECFCRVDSSSYYGPRDQESFEIDARSVDWNGTRFGYRHRKFRVDRFVGAREIRGLVVYPASFHPAQKEAETKALARGRRFHELAGRHYMAYSGVMRYGTAKTQYQRYMDGRIVVDADGYLHANPNKGADLLLCEPQVLGYSLQHKIWGAFNVNGIVPIAWNDTAFSSLMLPSGYKDLVLSFVEGQAAHRDVFDDVIEGKGQGIIMLLVGSPGTGKTLTAEAIADQVRKPLYALSAGELGQQAGNVECRLNTVLELTEKWDAVLLFDECDVFLEERSGSQLQHNEVVAVFLRCLEYYRGIMIMTSNRADAIDRAFQSRIHLTLHYPDLGVAAREQIWRRCMARARCQHALTDEEFQQLALVAINGRQIKNTVRVAALLAARRDMRLGMEQIYLVLRATRMIGA
ncbi:P-loop containing nucleoside triphosphate hydrolase protein [Aspergillus indologenus CBS 114.80]|uniref:P-loop containing nucleoside triphosphate hydrolase protein n=1 Tax=Aspergillus indologenus CBS 114.80 TaxID=1450541 RepID=A0A2V5IAU6_9EURO|nr:P-loop containing nucleoside triphosphate hydrolase protein [Aspergillus indologenus CBS 114.80]